MNFSASKTAVILISTLLLTLFGNNSFAASSNDICKKISANRNTVIFDDNLNENKYFGFDAGEMTPSALKNDFIPSKLKYHLVLFPKSRFIENYCSMSICVEAEKLASRCAGTNEYLISISVNPKKFGPNSFKNNFDLKITTAMGPDSNRHGFSFQELIEGSIEMPWISSVKSTQQSAAALLLFRSEPATIEVQLQNIGTKNYIFGDWMSEVDQGKYYQLSAGSCKNKTLSPKEICSISIKKTSSELSNTSILEWLNTFEGEDLNIRLQFEKINEEKAGINIYNLE